MTRPAGHQDQCGGQITVVLRMSSTLMPPGAQKFDCVMEFCGDRVNFNDFKVTAMSRDLDLDCGLWPLELVRMTKGDEHGNEFLKLNVGVRVGERPGPASSREPPRGVQMWAKKRETKLTDEEKNTLGLSGGGSWGGWW